ncbi:MAG: zinc metallopeptidase [Clostridia bacterium]|jgi:hypothetical protein|nr:zinc metallopeptidase [Clostridia bacterium]MDD3862641.1 zinc metallopeptidase [Clostridia bacterium]
MDFILFLQEYYLYIIIGVLIISSLGVIIAANLSYDAFVRQFEKMKDVPTSFFGTAMDMAKFLNSNKFFSMLKIETFEKAPNKPNGSYMPYSKILKLSDKIAFNNSIASIAITAHELGHAAQQFENSKKLSQNLSLMCFVKILGTINYPVFFAAIFFFIAQYNMLTIICLTFIGFSFLTALILKYVTINLEKDASNRAVNLLKDYDLISEQEIIQVKKFLKAARKTYTGDFFRALFAWTGLTRKTRFF